MTTSDISHQKNRGLASAVKESAATVATLSLIASLLFDWGYFTGLGLTFLQAPIGLTDHLQSWGIWAPWLLLIVVMFAVVTGIATAKYSGQKTEEQRQQSALIRDLSRSLSRSKDRLSWLRHLPVISLVASIVGVALMGTTFLPVATVSILLFGLGIFSRAEIVSSRGPVSPMYQSLMIAISAVFILVFYAGLLIGTIALANPEPGIALELKETNNVSSTYHGFVIRSFESWLLFEDSTGNVSWVNKDTIKTMRIEKWPEQGAGLLCHWNVLTCAERATTIRDARARK